MAGKKPKKPSWYDTWNKDQQENYEYEFERAFWRRCEQIIETEGWSERQFSIEVFGGDASKIQTVSDREGKSPRRLKLSEAMRAARLLRLEFPWLIYQVAEEMKGEKTEKDDLKEDL